MIVGHYGCGGVGAALDDLRVGIADNWLRHVRDIAERHEERLKAIDDHQQRYDRLCELNVIEQVAHVCQTTIVEDAWQRGQTVIVHGWVYGLHDSCLRDLDVRSEEHTYELQSLMRILYAVFCQNNTTQ